MRQTKRKFVALGTALAMALVLVASLVPSFGAKAQEITPSDMQVSLMPDGTLYDGSKDGDIARLGAGSVDSFTVDATNKVVTFTNLSVSRIDVDANGYTFVFNGTNTVKTQFVVETEMGVDDFTLSLGNNSTLKAGSGEEYQGFYGKIKLADGTTSSADISDAMGVQATVSGPSGGDDPSPTPDPDPTPTPTDNTDVTTIENGGTATLNPSADGTVSFRIEKDFEYFQNGGKLYVDGLEVPNDQYYATPGSTIITFVKEYASKLSDGLDHAVKVVFSNGEEFNATIKVSPASSDGTAANGTSGTASSTAATTTKVTSPKTADVLPIAGIALVFVGATAIGVIAIRRKNS